MSDKMRWRYGDTNPVVAAVEATTVIEIGDLLYQFGSNARTAPMAPNYGSQTANQSVFADKFLGVAMQRSRVDDVAPIRVATTGVFEFDCPSTAFELGVLLGVDENASHDGLLCQQLATVTSSSYAIGRVAKREPNATTSVLVDVRSTVMTGGIEGSSPSGV